MQFSSIKNSNTFDALIDSISNNENYVGGITSYQFESTIEECQNKHGRYNSQSNLGQSYSG